MSRLPVPGQDDNVWGQILNDFLSVSNNSDGTLQTSSLQQAGAITSLNGKKPSNGSLSFGTADLLDASISGPTNNQIIAYDASSGKWVNQTPGSGVGLDNAATDIQPLGTRAAGVTGLAADAGHVHAMPRLDQIVIPTSDINLNTQKITHLANGTAASDAAAFGQIPTSLPPNGTAAGDLSGSYPAPTVSKVNGVTVSGTPSSGEVLTASSGTAAAWSAIPETNDWLNVKAAPYNAKGDGSTNDTAAIQAALNAASPGQTVYLPVGTYVITAPLSIPPTITFQGSHGGIASADTLNTTMRGSVIQIASSFSSSLPVSAAIAILDVQAGGWTSLSSSAAGASIGVYLRDFFVDGQFSPANVDGIAGYGAIDAARFLDIGLNAITGNGMVGYINGASSGQPDGWHAERIIAQNVAKDCFGKFIWNDCTFIDCHAQGGGTGGDGFNINQASVRLIGCRAEFKNNSFTISILHGTPTNGYGPIILSGCTSDQSNAHGLNIINPTGVGSDQTPVIVNGCQFDDAGAAGQGSGFAGISVQGPNTKVYISNTNVWTSNSSAPVPDYGLKIATVNGGGPKSVRISGSSVLNGNLAAINNDGTAGDFYISPDVMTITGGPGTYAFDSDPYESMSKFGTVTVQKGSANAAILQLTNTTSGPSNPSLQQITAGVADNTYGIKVSGDANNRFKIDSTGKLQWGPGSSGQDTDLYRSAAGTLKTDNSFDVGGSLIVSEAAAAGEVVQITNATSGPVDSNLKISSAASGDNSLGINVTGDAANRFKIDSTGKLQWGPGSSGQDTDLYRSAAGTLKTDNSFSVGGILAVSEASSVGAILAVTNTTSGPATSNVEIVSAASGDNSLGIQVSGDVSNRIKVDSAGKIQWGPGNASQDTDLYRAGNGALQTDGSFTAGDIVASGLTGATAASRYVGATVSGSPASGTFAIGDFAVDQTGKLWICTAAGSPGTWAQASTSVNLPLNLSSNAGGGNSFSITNTANAPSSPTVGLQAKSAADSTLGIEVTGDADYRLAVDSNGKLAWSSGSAASDLDLYRASGGVLATDNSLDVAQYALGVPQPRSHGAIAWTYDPACVSNGQLIISGTVYLCAVWVNRAASVTAIHWGNNSAASGITAGANFVGLYNSSGALLVSTGIDASIATTGQFATAVTSTPVTPGMYWIGLLANATTMPKPYATSNLAANLINFALTGTPASLRYAINGTGQSSLSSVTPSANTASQISIWAALT